MATTTDPLMDLLRQQLAANGPDEQGPAGAEPDVFTMLVEHRQRMLEEAIREQEAASWDDDDDYPEELISPDWQQYTDLAAERDALYLRLQTLAEALGACGQCWGEDQACRWCRGRGRPGVMQPEPETFEQFVAPAVRAFACRWQPDPSGSVNEPTQTEKRRAS